MNQITIFAMQHNEHNKQFRTRAISPKIVKKTVLKEKNLKKERHLNLEERLAYRFRTELPIFTKEPIQNISINNIDLLPEISVSVFDEDTTVYNCYPIHDNCCLEWTEQ
jgi:hypothetical protein